MVVTHPSLKKPTCNQNLVVNLIQTFKINQKVFVLPNLHQSHCDSFKSM